MFFRKTRKSRLSVRRRTAVSTRKTSRFLELAIVAIFALVLIYSASLVLRITRGFSQTVETPRHSIRLQILNGCGLEGAANRAVRALPTRIRLPLEMKIVDVDNFSSYDVDESFIISRQEDLTVARLLAEQLGLRTDNILYQPIENNHRSVTATLVLGKDYESAVLNVGPTKEN